MAGKKKKKEGKGKKDGGEGKLPPPPNIDQNREGTTEALLDFQIRGKEEAICLVEEEAETYKEKNYGQLERNYQLREKQAQSYKALIQEARKLEEGIEQAQAVDRDRIDAELKEKLELMKQFECEEKDLRAMIRAVDEEYEAVREEVQRWNYYKSEVRGKRSEYITKIVEKMKTFKIKEKQLQDELTEIFETTKMNADEKFSRVQESQKREGARLAIRNLDQETVSEHFDNKWLLDQVSLMQRKVEELRKEVDALEHRNIQFISAVSETQDKEIQAMSDLYRLSTGRGLRSKQAGESELPSLVDVTKDVSDQNAGQAARCEMQLLSVSGSRPPFHVTPETVHLPPIEQQKSCHTALPPRTKWPISNSMLSSLLSAE